MIGDYQVDDSDDVDAKTDATAPVVEYHGASFDDYGDAWSYAHSMGGRGWRVNTMNSVAVSGLYGASSVRTYVLMERVRVPTGVREPAPIGMAIRTRP